MQKRIYAASRRGDVKQCRKLQKTLMRSWSNRVLAVRRVTQDNQGKKTAGVDGIKSLPPKARLELAGQIKLTGKSKPTRRVWIPKPGREEKRPLGIPTMYDRALQAVVIFYYSNTDAKTVGELSKQDYLTYLKLRQWAKRRCGNINDGHIKYWTSIGSNNWVFATSEGTANPLRLLNHNEFAFSSTDYAKVKGDKSPYDGDTVYWSIRLRTHPQMPNRKAELLKQQKGKCPCCGLSFQEWDVMDEDHIIPRALGGKDEYKNLQLLHRHCHDEKTALDLIEIRKKNHSKFLEKLSQFWEKFDWKWINDIPSFIGLKAKVLNVKILRIVVKLCISIGDTKFE